MNPNYLWVPVAAISTHMFEEFVWPGGFLKWYRHYPPGRTVAVSATLVVWINVLFTGLALLIPALGPTPRGWALWLVVAAVAGVNGVFHVVATIRGKSYSPGVVSGVLLYIPLCVLGFMQLLNLQLVSVGTALQAVIIAGVYQSWSTWKHGRAVKRAGS